MNITPTYFSPSLPVVIDSVGEYLTRGGEKVSIVAIGNSVFGAAGFYHDKNATRDTWNKTGRLYFTYKSDNDIVSKLS